MTATPATACCALLTAHAHCSLMLTLSVIRPELARGRHVDAVFLRTAWRRRRGSTGKAPEVSSRFLPRHRKRDKVCRSDPLPSVHNSSSHFFRSCPTPRFESSAWSDHRPLLRPLCFARSSAKPGADCSLGSGGSRSFQLKASAGCPPLLLLSTIQHIELRSIKT